MSGWFWYALVAAILYGAHQIFTKLAADRIGEGLGGFVVEATAALSILVYLAFLWLARQQARRVRSAKPASKTRRFVRFGLWRVRYRRRDVNVRRHRAGICRRQR